MDKIVGLFTGGWLKGHRTQVLAIAAFVGVGSQWLVGDLDFQAFISQAWPTLAVILGLLTAAVHKPGA